MPTNEDDRGSELSFADERLLLAVLDRALDAMRDADIPFLVMGGIASAILGRPRWTRDIDLFVRLEDAGGTLQALEGHGFECRVVDRHWLAKADLDGITVDVISRSSPDILLDEEMVRRAVAADFKGRALRLVPPEDLVVMKSLAASEDTPRYWYDAIAIVARSDLDWEYLVRRARAAGARRVLSVLLFAQSLDLVVPHEPIRTLYELVEGRSASAASASGA